MDCGLCRNLKTTLVSENPLSSSWLPQERICRTSAKVSAGPFRWSATLSLVSHSLLASLSVSLPLSRYTEQNKVKLSFPVLVWAHETGCSCAQGRRCHQMVKVHNIPVLGRLSSSGCSSPEHSIFWADWYFQAVYIQAGPPDCLNPVSQTNKKAVDLPNTFPPGEVFLGQFHPTL